MEVFKAVQTVLAVREYEQKTVPAETLRRIVESAWLTASSMNRQPWHFVLVEDRDTLQKMGSMVRTGPYIAGAAAAVVVAIEDTKFAVSDASRAVQSMVLTAWSEGVGSNWVGFFGLEDFKPLLGIPDPLQVFAVVPLGYPVKDIGRGIKNRKPMEEVVHRGRFGQPYQ